MLKIVNNSLKYYDKLYEIHTSELLEEDRMSKENFFLEFSQNFRKYFVALYENEVVGYIGLFECDKDYNIIGICVKEKFHNMGIGTKLINYSKKIAKKENKKSLSLEVDNRNILAINFYKKNGFIVTNIRKKYYKDNDALIMFCYL